MCRNSTLPSPRELTRRAEFAKERMLKLFQRRTLEHLSGYCKIGLKRIEEKLAMSLVMTDYMKKRKIRSIDALADHLFIGEDHIEVLMWLRSPTAFRKGCSQKNYDDFLFALCGIDWDIRTKSFVFVGDSAN